MIPFEYAIMKRHQKYLEEFAKSYKTTMIPTDQRPQECVHFCHCIDRVAIAEEVANNIEWHCELQNDCPDYRPKQEKDNESNRINSRIR